MPVENEWIPRIGPAAAESLRHSTRVRWVTAASWVVFAVIAFVTLRSLPGDSDARGWFALVALALVLLSMIPAGIVTSRARSTTRRLAAAFLRLPDTTGERMLPSAALRTTTTFDNIMWSRGMSPKGYTPHPSPSWVANNARMFGTGTMGNGRISNL